MTHNYLRDGLKKDHIETSQKKEWFMFRFFAFMLALTSFIIYTYSIYSQSPTYKFWFIIVIGSAAGALFLNYAIDGSLSGKSKILLTIASDKESKLSAPWIAFWIYFFITTLSSVICGFIVEGIESNKPEILVFQETIKNINDSNKDLLVIAQKDVTAAQKRKEAERERLTDSLDLVIETAVNSAKSTDHRKLYDRAKSNKEDWFWTVTDPQNRSLISYRNRIIEAKKNKSEKLAAFDGSIATNQENFNLIASKVAKDTTGQLIASMAIDNHKASQTRAKVLKYTWIGIQFVFGLGFVLSFFSLKRSFEKHGAKINFDKKGTSGHIIDMVKSILGIPGVYFRHWAFLLKNYFEKIDANKRKLKVRNTAVLETARTAVLNEARTLAKIEQMNADIESEVKQILTAKKRQNSSRMRPQNSNGNGTTANGKNSTTASATCPNCETEFVKRKWNHKFCKEACKIEHWTKKNGRDPHFKKSKS